MNRPPLASPVLLRVLLRLLYVYLAAAGASVLLFPPATYSGLASIVTAVWGIALLVGGALAVVGIVTRWHFLEWGACYVVAAGLIVYAGLSWWLAGVGGLGHLPRALLVSAGVFAVLARGSALANEDWAARQARIVRGPEVG